jgi:hypothetical protein
MKDKTKDAIATTLIGAGCFLLGQIYTQHKIAKRFKTRQVLIVDALETYVKKDKAGDFTTQAERDAHLQTNVDFIRIVMG